MPYSTACSTALSNFEAGQNYKDVSDPAVVVSFPLDGDEREPGAGRGSGPSVGMRVDGAGRRMWKRAPQSSGLDVSSGARCCCRQAPKPPRRTFSYATPTPPPAATDGAHMVAWTTTPWTLPSNLALCVNAEFEYVKVRKFFLVFLVFCFFCAEMHVTYSVNWCTAAQEFDEGERHEDNQPAVHGGC